MASAVSDKFGAPVPVATIEAFLKSLEEKWLLDTPSVAEKLVNIESQKLKDGNLLYWKLASINPEKIFAWLLPRTRWAFTKAFHVFAALSIVAGSILNYLNWDEFTGSAAKLFNLHGLFFLWIVVFTVITMHEFSHGLTCCHFGGKVREVGFMLIYFQPAFFCNVSDAWLFPENSKRLWVSFAGAYFELEALYADELVTLKVRDTGRWRLPRGSDRGRGLKIIAAAVDELDLHTTDAGTELVMRRRLNGPR